MSKAKGRGDADDVSEAGHSTDLEPLRADPFDTPYDASQRSWGQAVQSLVLLLSCLASLGVAAIGFFFLVYIFFSRSFSPPAAHIVKDLFFDYSESSAVAASSLLESTAFKGEQLPAARALPSGQKMNIWLELEAAEAYGNVNTDIFQVLAQLRTPDGRIAATASRPCMLTSWSPLVQSVRAFFTAPMVLAGLWREHQRLKVLLFSRYPDQQDKPFTEFRTVLRVGNKGGHLPHLYSAKVHVDLILGIFGRIIYWMRPGTWTMLFLAAASVSAVGGGLLVAAATFLVWLYSGSKPRPPVPTLPQSDDEEQEDLETDESETERGDSKMSDQKSSRRQEAKGSPLKSATTETEKQGKTAVSSLNALLKDTDEDEKSLHLRSRKSQKQPAMAS